MESRHDSRSDVYRSGCSWFGVPAKSPPPLQDGTLTVFIAASMKNAIGDIARHFTGIRRESRCELRGEFRARPTNRARSARRHLASADLDWMDYAARS
jgi:hypothetical protein